ncbi:hypothetical protein Ancab_005130, partial [Ancistrocladus abbreviatus]
ESFDINGDFVLNHPSHQSNSNSYVEESIHSSGKTQTRLLEMDELRTDLEDPVCTGGGYVAGNHNDLTKAQDPLGSIYLEGINESEEGLDGFPIQNLEINAVEPIQNQEDAGEYSQAKFDEDIPSEANDETPNEIGDPQATVISKRHEKKRKKLEEIINLRLFKGPLLVQRNMGGHIPNKGKKSGRNSDGKKNSQSVESINDSQIINRNWILYANDNPAENLGPKISPSQIKNFLRKIGVEWAMDQDQIFPELRIWKREMPCCSLKKCIKGQKKEQKRLSDLYEAFILQLQGIGEPSQKA